MRYAARLPVLILLMLATCNADTEQDGALDRIPRTGLLRVVRRLGMCSGGTTARPSLMNLTADLPPSPFLLLPTVMVRPLSTATDLNG